MVYESSSDFRRFNIVVSSKLVLAKLVKHNVMFMWNLMISLSVEQGGFGWKIFENICHNRMLGDPLEYSNYRYYNGTALVIGQNNSPLMLGGCNAIKGTTGNLITAARRDERVLFYSYDPKYPLIDYIYRTGSTFYAFQTTVGKTHSCDVKHLFEFAM